MEPQNTPKTQMAAVGSQPVERGQRAANDSFGQEVNPVLVGSLCVFCVFCGSIFLVYWRRLSVVADK
jgi:hypothetical protein